MASKAKRLAKGRRQRQATSRVLGMLEAGEFSVLVLLSPQAYGKKLDPGIKRVRIHHLLCRVPHLGEKGVDKVLKAAGVWPTARLGELTRAELERIIEHLPERAK
jgi:hypothetical protein